MGSRNLCKAPHLPPLEIGDETSPRPVAKHNRELARTPWQNPEGWWKLTTSGRIWRAQPGARRWHWTPWFVANDQLWHSNNNASAEKTESLLEMLADGLQQEIVERLEKRAEDARRHRALKPTLPTRQCCCCGCIFAPKRNDARCCSGRCRAKQSRQKTSAAAEERRDIHANHYS